ncbi:MAG: dihydroorotate dehydrogenase electron transfer subunit [Acidobacteria bacterium]|nr:dihydroorotate dehydrogenase electron transfer subunit [Acidobacteriota bacterium]
MIETVCSVVENHRLQPGYFRLRLRVRPPVEPAPGQFAMVRSHGEYEPLLRRALVFYRSYPGEGFTDVDFVFRTMGRGTSRLSRLRAGDWVDFLGPLGRGFEWRAAGSGNEALLVSGGVGIPAFFLWAEQLCARNVEVRLFHGDRTSDREQGLICVNDFAALLGSDHVACTTEDGSAGSKGLVTDLIEHHLIAADGRPRRIFACGPHAMMRRVAELGSKFGIETQVCLEAPMACGFGICVACVVRLKRADSDLSDYHRVCLDGPVFDAERVIWD